MDQPTPKKYLRIRDAAERLDVAYNTIRNEILDGRLPACKVRGTYRIRPEDLDDYIRAYRIEAPGRTATPSAPRPSATTLKHLDGARLLAAWTAQGVRVPRPGGGSARSSASTHDPSDGTES
jgi:excisionase family DNA binding protein